MEIGRPRKVLKKDYETLQCAFVKKLNDQGIPATSRVIMDYHKQPENREHLSLLATLKRDLRLAGHTYGRHSTKHIQHDSPSVVAYRGLYLARRLANVDSARHLSHMKYSWMSLT